jgi:hypothetical protein
MFPSFVPFHIELNVGQTWSDRLVWHVQAANLDRVEEDLVTFAVLSGGEGAFQVKVDRKLLRTRLPGVVIEAPKTAPPDVATTSVHIDRLFGLPAWSEAPRLGRLLGFEAIRTVEAYTVALSQPSLPKAVLVVEEDVPAESGGLRAWHWTVHELSGATPISAVGELWTRGSDGRTVRMHLEADNVPMPDGESTGRLIVDLGPAS